MNINSRWLYRAAGTVGIAGGFLALAAGTAQADDTDRTNPESMNGVLGDVFSPTSGLPPLDLGGTAPAAPSADRADAGDAHTDRSRDQSGPADTSGLTLDPNDGRPGHGDPELLPALPVGSLLGGLPLGNALGADPLNQVPLDGVAPGGAVGTGLPTDSLLDVDGGLVDAPGLPAVGDATTLPAVNNATTLPAPAASDVRTLPAPAGGDFRTLPAPAAAPGQGSAAELAGDPELVGAMPSLTEPVTNAVLGGKGLGDLVTIGNLAGQVPVAGPMVSQTAGSIPFVSDIAPSGHHQSTAAVAPAGPTAATGERLPAVIGDELEARGGFSPGLLDGAPAGASPELLPGGLPLVGDGLAPVSQLVGVGDIPSQLPLVGPLAGSTLGGLPVVGNPAAAPSPGPAPAVPGGPAAGPAPVAPAATETERPIAGEDPEFAESAEFLPVGDPVAGLTQQLPVPSPAHVLSSLPVVGGVSGLLPL